MTTAPRNRGFTLIELLVSMVIFTTIMAGVAIMFNSSVRVTKQAYLNQGAFETMRGVFDTIENDVTKSFVSRETGHKHTFYGTPIGFTFIGLVNTEGSSDFNTARITYVMYADPFGLGLTKTLQTTADDNNPSEAHITYSLLRYIEPGVEDLESFPIQWTSLFQGDTPNLTLDQEINFARTDAFNSGLCLSNDLDDPCLEEVTKAKKRELWIRMLAGDLTLPHFWDNPNNTPTVRTSNISTLIRNPADYVIAENIVHIDRHRTGGALPAPFEPEDNRTYTPIGTAPFGLVLNPFIDTSALDLAIIESLDPLDANYITTDAFKIANLIFINSGASKFTHQNYFFAYREFAEQGRFDNAGNKVFKVTKTGLLLNDELAGTDIQEQEFEASLFSFWNDTRNLEHNTILSAVNTFGNTNPSLTEDLISTQPDIIDPALPESIMIQFTFFYESPYPGAPDFERIFTHSINLPTAYKRKLESLETKLMRGD